MEESLPVSITVYNRGRARVSVVEALVPRGGVGVRSAQQRPVRDTGANAVRAVLLPDSQQTVVRTAIAMQPTQSWWTAEGRIAGLFVAPVNGEEETERQLRTKIMSLTRLEIDGVPVDWCLPS